MKTNDGLRYNRFTRVNDVKFLLTIKPFVIGISILNTIIRAFSLVVALIGELGSHKILPTLKKEKENI